MTYDTGFGGDELLFYDDYNNKFLIYKPVFYGIFGYLEDGKKTYFSQFENNIMKTDYLDNSHSGNIYLMGKL